MVASDSVYSNVPTKETNAHNTDPFAGCQCDDVCDGIQCGVKCSCDFWFDSPQTAMQETQRIMDKNRRFRHGKYSHFSERTSHRIGNDYYGRQMVDANPNGFRVQLDEEPYDRRSQSSFIDPFEITIHGKTKSWSRFEDDDCYYKRCKKSNTKTCAWFYDFDSCGHLRNNNGRYYDQFFARAKFDFA
eukprot:CAMPEP_0202700168 /NCGR_PEP_ID=MMETSP1385-20130828/13376_1 /ASSEMBLY_ACC=CAM_ASM_000861 /TAXON_ID=933848 /ORGANISM="Elphidium margaritaceum" /LENGTH=186 /DNA_ID=CAMNT_0049357297 /DNA_START=103 /DNA_END=659 /DNA_ORIENTATION=+